MRIAAIKQLGSYGNQASIEAILTALDDEHASVRAAAARVLEKCEDERLVERLTHMTLHDSDWFVRQTALRTLGKQGARAPIDTFLAALNDEDAYVRAAAVDMLMIWEQGTPEKLAAALKDQAWVVREAAVLAIGSLKERAPVEPLLAALRDAEWQVRDSARRTLEQTHPEVLPAIPADVISVLEMPGESFERSNPPAREKNKNVETTGERMEPVMEIKDGAALQDAPLVGRVQADPAPRVKRFKRLQTLVQSLAAVLLVGLLLGGFLVLFNSHHPGTTASGPHYTWCIVPANSPSGDYLSAVASISANDAWAVGAIKQGGSSIEHWNGARWQVVSNLPNQQNFSLNAISALSASDIWAVGSFNTGQSEYNYNTLIEHWNGKQWSIIPSPNAFTGNMGDHNSLNGVSAVAPNDVWAVGFAQSGSGTQGGPLIEHWNGARWSIVPGQDAASNSNRMLHAVAAISPNDVWAVGDGIANGRQSIAVPLIEHWDGKQWRIVHNAKTGLVGAATLNGIAAVSSTDIWAVGEEDSASGPQSAVGPLIEHWDGTQWRIVTAANTGAGTADGLNAITAISATDIWAVGQSTLLTSVQVQRDNNLVSVNPVKMLIEHWDGTRWSVIASPNGTTDLNRLYGVAATRDEHVWAVGMAANNGTNEGGPRIEKLCAL